MPDSLDIPLLTAAPLDQAGAAQPGVVLELPVEQVHRSPFRPVAPAPSAAALAAWLAAPQARERVLVRPRAGGGHELLIGEFHWRLAQAARCAALGARVLPGCDDGLARQLATLDAQRDGARQSVAAGGGAALPWGAGAKMAIARAMRGLRRDQGWSLTAASGLFGLSRAEGAHYLKVLALPPAVLDLVDEGALSFGQARALARLSAWPERVRILAHKVAALPGTPARARRRRHSVRELEGLVAEVLREVGVDAGNGRDGGGTGAAGGRASGGSARRTSRDLARVERLLGEHCGFPVQVDFDPATRHGRLVVRFSSVDEFQSIAERLAPGIDFEGD